MKIELKKYINADYSKNILVIGVIHGDEPQGEYFINRFLEEENKFKNNMYFIPRLNFSNSRKNLNGVDLNRNFPTKNWERVEKNDPYYGGEFAKSEAETRFLLNLGDEIKFDAIITIHSPYKIVNYDGPAEKLAAIASKILNLPLQKDIGYLTPGSMGTYFGIERDIPIITIECSEEELLENVYPKFREFFLYLGNIL